MLPARAFTGLTSLLRLSLFGNKINLIDPLAFDGIGGNLTRINLGGNLLTSVPTASLKDLQSLQVHKILYSLLIHSSIHPHVKSFRMERNFRGLNELGNNSLGIFIPSLSDLSIFSVFNFHLLPLLHSPNRAFNSFQSSLLSISNLICSELPDLILTLEYFTDLGTAEQPDTKCDTSKLLWNPSFKDD